MESQAPSGILLLDKPVGPTSHDLVAQVRRWMSRGVRVGHCGTLDPMASGLMLIAVGASTRLSQFLLGLDKEYVGQITFGASTDTDDSEGAVLSRADVSSLRESDVVMALESFVGHIEQIPPAYSALKIGGKRAHALARAGREVKLAPREVDISQAEMVSFDLPHATVRIRCSSGTYIRSIARDLGQELGLPAHLSALRRTAIGKMNIADARSADASDWRHHLVAPAHALNFLPAVHVGEIDIAHLRHGRRPPWDALESTGPHRALNQAGDLVAIVEGRPSDRGWTLRSRVILPPK